MTGQPTPDAAQHGTGDDGSRESVHAGTLHAGTLRTAIADLTAAFRLRRLTVVIGGRGEAGAAALADAITAAGGEVVDVGDGTVNDPGADAVVVGAAVLTSGADLGIVLVDDAAACVVVGDDGAVVDPSVVAMLVGMRLVGLPSADRVLACDLMTSQVITDLLPAAGVEVLRTAPGPAAVVAAVTAAGRAGTVTLGTAPASWPGAARGAFFCTGDGAPGAVAAVAFLLAAVASQTHGIAVLGEVYSPYPSTGVVDVPVADVAAAMQRVDEAYRAWGGAGEVTVERRGGLTVRHWDDLPRWWFTLLARDEDDTVQLFVEAEDDDMLTKVSDDLLTLLRG